MEIVLRSHMTEQSAIEWQFDWCGELFLDAWEEEHDPMLARTLFSNRIKRNLYTKYEKFHPQSNWRFLFDAQLIQIKMPAEKDGNVK